MPQRVVNVTPGNLGALDAYTDVIANLSEIVDGGEVYDFRKLFYATMVQCGVQGFRMYGDPPKEVANSLFLSQRTVCVDTAEFTEQAKRIDDILRAYTIKEGGDTHVKGRLSHMSYFLSDLLLTAKTGRAMVSTLRPPDAEELRGILRPEILHVLSNLLGAIDTVSVPSPVPRLEVPSGAVKRFEDVLLSDLFRDYSQRHAELEVANIAPAIAVANVREAGKRLVQRFGQTVSVKEAAVRIIPVTTALVDTIGGKVLGIVAKAFGESFARILQDDRRLVIYCFHEVFDQIWGQRLLRVRRLLNEEQNKQGNR